jgi:hypothetical protein
MQHSLADVTCRASLSRSWEVIPAPSLLLLLPLQPPSLPPLLLLLLLLLPLAQLSLSPLPLPLLLLLLGLHKPKMPVSSLTRHCSISLKLPGLSAVLDDNASAPSAAAACELLPLLLSPVLLPPPPLLLLLLLVL